MRTPGRSRARAGSVDRNRLATTIPFTPGTPPLQRPVGDWPSIVELPVDDLHLRPMRAEERSLVVCTWWAMRRKGVKLPPQPGVIVIEGGRA